MHSLRRQLEILDATVKQKVVFEKLLAQHSHLQAVPIPGERIVVILLSESLKDCFRMFQSKVDMLRHITLYYRHNKMYFLFLTLEKYRLLKTNQMS